MKSSKTFLFFLILFISTMAITAQENTKNVSVWLKQQNAQLTNDKDIFEYKQWATQKLNEATTLFKKQEVLSQLSSSDTIIKNKINGAEKNSPSHLFIFVSFSMPQQSLKQWLQQAHELKGTVVIRGLVNNSFRDTVSKVRELVHENKGGLQINPALFKKYHIEQVPAVVLEDNTNFDVVYGDVPLCEALRVIAQQKYSNRA